MQFSEIQYIVAVIVINLEGYSEYRYSYNFCSPTSRARALCARDHIHAHHQKARSQQARTQQARKQVAERSARYTRPACEQEACLRSR